MQEFLADCARSLQNWQPGALTYPRRFTVADGKSATFAAQIDIRSGAQQQAPGPGGTVVPVQVRCGVGARLVSLGKTIAVDNTDWVLRQFDHLGPVQWNWTVTASGPDSGQLRLELRPAVAVVDGGYVVPAEDDTLAPTAAFTTEVSVQAGPLTRAANWFQNDWPQITTIVVALGGAISAVLAWVIKQRRRLQELRGSEDAAGEAGPDARVPAPRASPAPGRRRSNARSRR